MTSRTTQYPPYPHPQIHVRGCSLSLPPSYGLGHQIPEDDAKKWAPTPASTRAQPTPTIPCRKNMKTQCLSLHIVTIYPLVLKRTKKKSQATTDDHNCSNCNSSIYFYFFSHIKLHNAKNKSSKLCHDRMDKKHRSRFIIFEFEFPCCGRKK